MTGPTAVRLDGHRHELTPGREFTARLADGRKRLRFSYARRSPSGVLELTGFDGRRFRTARADQVERVHYESKVKVPAGASAPPPPRRGGRR